MERISVGLENLNNILQDIDHSLDKASRCAVARAHGPRP
jgi:hypothetical protein